MGERDINDTVSSMLLYRDDGGRVLLDSKATARHAINSVLNQLGMNDGVGST